MSTRNFMQVLDVLYLFEQQHNALLSQYAELCWSPGLRDACEATLAESRCHLRRLEEIAETFGGPLPIADSEWLDDPGDIFLALGGGIETDFCFATSHRRTIEALIRLYLSASTLANTLNLTAAIGPLDECLREKRRAERDLSQLLRHELFAQAKYLSQVEGNDSSHRD